MKNKKYLLIILAVIIIPLCGCELLGITEEGSLSFDDFIDTGRILSNATGTIVFEDKLVQMGDRAVESLKMTNSGTGDLKIINAEVLGDCFSFIDDKKPDLPIVIPSGKTINDIFVEFDPDTAGDYEGTLLIETESNTYYFDLSGTGLWQLTITVDAGDACSVTSPVKVTPGESKTVTTSTGELDLVCVLDSLNEFNDWNATAEGDNAVFGSGSDYTKTTITINSHTEVNPEVYSPYVKVPGFSDSISAAITEAATHAPPYTVVVSTAYDSSNDSVINMVDGVSLKGGYVTNFTDGARAYLTAAERETTYKTTISLTGSINAGSAIGSDVVIEGFTINKTGIDSAAAILLNNTKAGVYYNTINGYGQAAGIEATEGTTSIISGNVITGGTRTANFSETYGIKVTEESDPIIYNNTISGGSAGGTNSTAYAVFSDFDCIVTAIGNTISGGSGSGSGSESYGIYLINNGKLFANYNNIDGGTGKTAYAVFTNYGGNLYLTYNNIYTSGGTNRYGVVSGFSGRLRKLTNNALYNCKSALISVYVSGSETAKTTIDDVNDYCNTDTNTGTAITISKTDYTEAKYE